MTHRTFHRWTTTLPVLALAGLAAGCGQTGGVGGDAQKSSAVPSAMAMTQESQDMSSEPNCAADNFARDACMIRLMLEDAAAHHAAEPGGGITRIEAGPGDTFTIVLPKEERTVLVTYEFDMTKDGKISIKSKNETVEAYGE